MVSELTSMMTALAGPAATVGAAIVGSSLTALLAVASRAARIHRSIAQDVALLASIDPSSVAYRGLSRSIDRRAAEIVAIRLVRWPGRSTFVAVSLLVVSVIFATTIYTSRTHDIVTAGLSIGSFCVYVVIIVGVPIYLVALAARTRRVRREKVQSILRNRPSGASAIDLDASGRDVLLDERRVTRPRRSLLRELADRRRSAPR